MIKNETLGSRLRQSLLETCSVRKRSAREALFQQLNYKTLLRRSTASSTEAIKRNQRRLKLHNSDFLKSGGVMRNWTYRGEGHVGTKWAWDCRKLGL